MTRLRLWLRRRTLPAPIPPRPRHCTCGASWCPYTPNKAVKAWWKP